MVNGKLTVDDGSFVPPFQVYQISGNLYTGPFPENREDVMRLQDHRIGGILNLITE